MRSLNLKCRLLAGLVAIQLFLPGVAFAENDDSLPPKEQPSSTALIAAALPAPNTGLSKHAVEAAKLLGVEDQVYRLIELKNSGRIDKEALSLQLSIIRKIMTYGLQLRIVSAKFDREITFERQALDKLSRERDFAVAVTNNANFLQLNILSTIIDGPLSQTRRESRILNANRLNIVSGLTVGGLAAIAFAEQRGGIRRSKPRPNLLGQVLGLEPPDSEKLPPFLWTYMNSVSPASESGLTRRQMLLEYWKTAKVLTIDIKKPSAMEKVSVLGSHHHQWNETIKLINCRVSMLFDLRAMVDLLNTGLVELLQALD